MESLKVVVADKASCLDCLRDQAAATLDEHRGFSAAVDCLAADVRQHEEALHRIARAAASAGAAQKQPNHSVDERVAAVKQQMLELKQTLQVQRC